MKIEESFKSVGGRIGSLSSHLEKLTDEISEVKARLSQRNTPQDRDEGHTCTTNAEITLKLKTIQDTVEEIKQDTQYKEPEPLKDLTPQLDIISEKLEIMSSELRTLRETKKTTFSHQKPSLETEMAVQEVKQTLDTIKEGVSKLTPQPLPRTFAQVAAKPRPEHLQQPNHTLIISSSNPKATSENVMSKIRSTLDLKKCGAKVERVRKARDQKVVMRCASKEDMAIIKGQVQGNKELTVREPTNQDPLVCVRGVLACFSNEEIVDHIRAQNGHILDGVDKASLRMKVRYRKRARNPLECNPVIELSPELWKRFTKNQKIYVGFGRCSVEDQSPLVQCLKCLGYGHTKALCKEQKDVCSHCGGEHTGRDCPSKAKNEPPKCVNCTRAKKNSSDLVHTAYSMECQERQKWDGIARSRVQYC
ncbi:unnamed protein product [Euphydryas editha]|uniref:Gag-like protein n=1 Tax=Euphydryas editha TaxID=104508 RepID=A0AAU9U0V5_EUPED|nr:unnamed protein product [Euphydryas editha]